MTHVNASLSLIFGATLLVFSVSTYGNEVAAPVPGPLPVPRIGPCPTGYYMAGNYCMPATGSRPAIIRVGACPDHYYSSGDYCVAGESPAPAAIHRVGACPSGYYSSGQYCVQSR